MRLRVNSVSHPAARRARDATADPGRLGRVSAALIGVMLIGYSVAIWAMTAKPD